MKRPDTLRGRRKGRGLLAGAAAAALLGLQACAPAHDIGVAQVPSAPAASQAARTAEAPSTRPNVLLIISDDLNTRLDTFGGPIAAPNLNNLAADGVAFNEAYSQFPWCGPSRASFLSGLRPSTVGVTDLRTPLRERIPNLVTLPQYFRENGYFTARSGKVFHQGVPEGIGKPGADDPASWDIALNPAGRDLELEPQLNDATPGLGRGSRMGWLAGDGPVNSYTDGLVADDVIGLIDRSQDEGKPFFIAAGFYRPHTPEITPEEFFRRYPLAGVETTSVDDVTAPFDVTAAWGGPDLGMTPEEQRGFIRAYYASASYVDMQVGRILSSLKQQGLDSNTIVVFISDHGFLLGEHHQWMKNALWEQATKVPLIIRAPGMAGNGHKSDNLVELVDLYPTLVDLAGLPKMASNEGESLKVLLEDPDTTQWDSPAFTQIAGARSVRFANWRYTEWKDGREELYDVQADRQETTNLALDPAYAGVVDQLSAMLPDDIEPIRPTLEYDAIRDCLHLPPNLPESVGKACDAASDP